MSAQLSARCLRWKDSIAASAQPGQRGSGSHEEEKVEEDNTAPLHPSLRHLAVMALIMKSSVTGMARP